MPRLRSEGVAMNAISYVVRYAQAEDWAEFLKPLLPALNARPSREEYLTRCGSIAFAMSVPMELLTDWRQREAVRRFKFLPSPAEVDEWLAPDLREWQAARPKPRVQGLVVEARVERTPDEIEHA